MTEWQPIETAPKDGSDIIAFFPAENKHGIDNFHPQVIAVVSFQERGWWEISNVSGWEMETEIDSHEGPTHWMPMPEPPRSI